MLGVDPPAPPIDGFDRESWLQGPVGFVFDVADALEIDSLASLAGLVVTVSGVMLTSTYELKPFQFTHFPNSNRTLATTRQNIGSGWLLRVRAGVTTGTPLFGQLYVSLRTCRGLAAAAALNGTIIEGYATANTDLYWPSSLAQGPLDGEGAPLSIAVSTPAAGADWSQTVPTGARWQFIAATATLTTAVAAATRAPRLLVDDGANTIEEVPAAATQAASLVGIYSFGAGAGGPIVSDVGFVLAPVANDLWLPAGFRIRTATGAIQAADQWSAIRLLVREWLEGS